MNKLTTKYAKKNVQSAQRIENKHPESLRFLFPVLCNGTPKPKKLNFEPK